MINHQWYIIVYHAVWTLRVTMSYLTVFAQMAAVTQKVTFTKTLCGALDGRTALFKARPVPLPTEVHE